MHKRCLPVIIDAARHAAPCEACGLIVSVNGNEQAVACRNISEDPRRNFILHPEDYQAAEKQGNVLAVWHTHPVTGAAPSEADRSACNRSGLPWFVYSLHEDRVEAIYPGDEIPLLGRRFCWGAHDCWTLVRDYYRQRLGIVLPVEEPYEERFWEKGRDYYTERYPSFGFADVSGPPREHDVLLMSVHSQVPNHAAVLLGDGKIMHHLQNRLSCIDVYGGYWRQITCRVLRHKEVS